RPVLLGRQCAGPHLPPAERTLPPAHGHQCRRTLGPDCPGLAPAGHYLPRSAPATLLLTGVALEAWKASPNRSYIRTPARHTLSALLLRVSWPYRPYAATCRGLARARLPRVGPHPVAVVANSAGFRPQAADAPELPEPCSRNVLPRHRLGAPCYDHQRTAHIQSPWPPHHPALLPGSGAPAAHNIPLAGRGTAPPESPQRGGAVPGAGP